MSYVEDKILSLLKDEMQLPIEDVHTDLIDEGVLDSLVFVDLIARLEEEFRFTIDLGNLDFDEFRNVEQISRYVAKEANVSAGPSVSSGPLVVVEGR